jgi:hypothetical protein
MNIQMLNKPNNFHEITSQIGVKRDGNEYIARFKENLILLKIISSRKSALNRITPYLKEHIRLIKLKRERFIEYILEKRKIAAEKIKYNFRAFYIRKRVRSVINKLKDHFCIISQIKNVRKIYLKAYPNKGKPQIFNFEYCPIRDQFVIYIRKDLLWNRSIKVNFIADEKIFIDPNFKTEYDKDGQFYNILEYEKFIKKEQEKEDCVADVMALIEDKRHRNLQAENEEFVNKINRNMCLSSGKFCGRNSISFSPNTSLAFNQPVSAIILPRIKTSGNLYSPKSILRKPDSSNGLNKGKRVSFTHIKT